MSIYSIVDLARTLQIEVFVLEEFFSSNNFEITDIVTTKIPNELSTKALQQKHKLEALQTIRKAELDSKIKYLQYRIETLELIFMGGEDELDVLDVYRDELYSAENLLISREMAQDWLIIDEEDEDSLDDQEPEEFQEYNVYNSYGYLCTVYNLRDARDRVKQFGGYILDEQNRKVF